MRRVTTSLVLALSLLGCSWFPGDRVQLLTDDGPYGGSGGCFTMQAVGELLADPVHGTAIRVDQLGGPIDPVPVIWPPGYTGWRVGSEVEVRDPAGNVVATSGLRYRLDGGYWSGGFWACNEVEVASAGPSDPVSAAPRGEASAAPTGEPSAAPSGKPIDLVRYSIQVDCQDQWAEGSLLTGVELQDRLLGTALHNPTTIEIWPFDTIVWPSVPGSDVAPERFVPVRWPMEYTGVRLASGEVAVLDGAGHIVATTGSKYRLKGDWAVVSAVGGPLFGKPPWIDAFFVCRGSESVIPKAR